MSQTPSTTTRAEETLWEGRPSQWTNFFPFLLCLLVIPIPYAIYRWLAIKCTTYRLTSQRLRISSGILNKHHDDLELYRVKDLTVTQPLPLRFVGLGNVNMVTSDATTPTLTLPAIKQPLEVYDLIRDEVQRLRRERGVRELDVHDYDTEAGAAMS